MDGCPMTNASELSLMYKVKDKKKLKQKLRELECEKNSISNWFINYNKKYSNSVLLKADYDSDIRKPYNEKWVEYERNIELYRVCCYYLEIIDE